MIRISFYLCVIGRQLLLIGIILNCKMLAYKWKHCTYVYVSLLGVHSKLIDTEYLKIAIMLKKSMQIIAVL